MFPILKAEKTLQVNDLTLLDASKSKFEAGDAVSIKTEATGEFVQLDDSLKLEWAYDAAGSYEVTLQITRGADTKTTTHTIEVVTAEQDALFTTDEDILALESTLLDLLPEGKSSYLNKHREAKKQILQAMDEMGYQYEDGSKVDESFIIDKAAIRDWSRYLTLSIIFGENVRHENDFFKDKEMKYSSKAAKAEFKAVKRVDTDKDGQADTTFKGLSTCSMVRQ